MNELSNKKILKMINNKELSPEEGLKLYKKLQSNNKNNINEESETLYFEYKWKKVSNLINDTNINENIVVFCLDAQVNKLLNKLEDSDNAVTLVKFGEEYNYKNGVFTIRENRYEDYTKLVKDLHSNDIQISTIIHIGSNDFVNNQENIEKQVSNIYSVFFAIKSLMKQKISNIKYFYIYDNKQNKIQPHHEAVSGFLKTTSMENSSYICKTIELVNSDNKEELIIKEIANNSTEETEIKYENNNRYIKEIGLLDSSTIPNRPLPIKENGVYLITGGAGGLGLIFAKHLAKIRNVNLILTGRSKLTPERDASQKEIKKLGSNVKYIQTDVSDKEQVEDLIKEIKKEYKKIDGIIHSAGIIRDSFILKKEKSDMEEVFAPKIDGLINLAYSLKEENLDFFSIFSSLSGITGNIGQSDYAYANCFMDSYAHLLKDNGWFKKVISINWPLWKDGGMEVTKKTEERILDEFGLVPMNTDCGTKAFETSLRLDNKSQLMVFQGNKDNIINALQKLKRKNPHQNKSTKISIVDKSIAYKKIEEYLKNMLSKETELPVSKIKTDEPFEKYGIDSVMIMNFNKYLGEDFKGLPKTLLFEYQNIDELSNYFVDNQLEKVIDIFKLNKNEDNIVKSINNEKSLTKTINKNRFINSLVKPSITKDIPTTNDIAIIGISGRYPMAKNIDEFWENLKIGKDCITEIPSDRWEHKDYYDPDKNKKGKSYSKWGGFIDDYDKFDPLFFNISPKEAELMDPQERLFLETAWHTIEDGGYTRKSLSDKKVGVFVGVMYGYYQFYGAEESLKGNIVALNSSYATIANRVSYILNLSGPSMAVDTMCSSSLTSIHLACDSLRLGESEIAIAGGVNLTIHPNKYILLSQGKFAASDGRCRSFGEGGDGYVPGEGVGAVLLKPLRKAEEDGDKIYGVIKGSSLNHGGKTNGYSVPNPKAQGELISETLKKSGIDPRTISYIEAHGTGTSLGDPIEISGLVKAYSEFTNDKQYCSIGSAKSVIGHLESAAGVAAVSKVLLQMNNKKLVPSIHSDVLNPNIDFSETPFYVQHKYEKWERPIIDGEVIPRRAGISSFGAGGSNAHIIIEEYNDKKEYANRSYAPQLFTISAKSKEGLRQYVKSIYDYVDKITNSEKEEKSNNEEKLSRKKNEILNDLLQKTSEIIHVDVGDISISEKIIEYGFDLVKFNKLVDYINGKYDFNIDTTIFNETTTIKSLADYLVEEFEEIILKQLIKSPSEEKEDTHKISLEDITYTLQIGREEMEERLALISSSLEDLKNKLSKFLDSEKDNLHYGNINDNEDDMALMLLDNNDLINKLVNERDLDKLAKLWVKGAGIKWEKLYEDTIVKKVSLPTYPFAKERYWIPEGDYTNEISFEKTISNIHPLINSNISDFDEQKYNSIFTGNEFFFKDHIVSEQKVLPGVAYIEMARVAGELASKRKVNKIKNIVWLKPIVIKEESKEVNINLYPSEEDVSFEIGVMEENGESTSYSYGELEFYGDSHSTTEEYIDINSIKERCNKKLEKDKLYELCKNNGINYGETFRSIKEIYSKNDEVIAKLELPDSLENSFEDYILHPSIMDGALQSIVSIIEKTNTPYLPFALDEVEILDGLSKTCYVHVEEVATGSNIKKYNLSICNQAGKTLVNLKGLNLRPQNNKVEKNISTLYYENLWERKELVADESIDKDNLIIFDKNNDLYGKFINDFNKVILVKQGNKFRKINNKTYEIRLENKEDYEKLFLDFKNNKTNYNKIIYNINHDEDNINIEKNFSKGIFNIFNISSVLMNQKLNEKVSVLYLYNQNTPLNESISSFSKTVKLENPYIIIKTIKLDLDSNMVVEQIGGEFGDSFDTNIQYTENERFVKSLSKINNNDLNNEKSMLKEDGVYIITGGLGGLGFIFAKYIANKEKANIILTGRSKEDEIKRLKIKELENLGSKAVYIQGDISNKNDVKNIINITKEKFGEINGIIHSAGITRDSLLLRKTKDEFESVLRPKILGTMWLDEETKSENLDFFTVFSSTTAVLGNVGQSDYAYANSFMDNYCYKREQLRKEGKRKGKSLSINWPLWKDGGMTMDEASQIYMKDNLGLIPLDTENGIEAFENGLKSDFNQIVVLHGEQEKINKMINGEKEEVKQINEIVEDSTNKNKLKERTEKFLKEILSKETKVSENRIDSKKAFEEYGIDSVMIINLNRELEKIFGELTKTLLFEYKSIRELADYFTNNHYLKLKQVLNLNTEDTIIKQTIEPEDVKIPTFNKTRFNKKKPIVSSTVDEDIAIIGLSGKYPKANNVKEYWSNLVNGIDCISEIPTERWDYNEYYDPDKDKEGKSYSKWGGFIEDVDKFDPLFFNISPKEAELMDPQERLFLENVWHTIEDAGYTRSKLSNSKVGVYVGVMYGHYQLYGVEESMKNNVIALSSSYASIANRISYYLNLNGPSLAVDTMCSSSLTSIHLACESIHRGESELAIAGGVNVSIHPNKYIALSQGRFFSTDGKCRSFGDGGDGYVPGEGVGAILLKPLSKAIKDKDNIYAVIKGSSINHGGKTNGYTVPNPNAQNAVISDALTKANIEPRTISYIEAHGTGTSLGDPIEITGLVKAFENHTKESGYCAIGSAKSNIGHLESAAGIAGITKVLLQMKYKKLVPSLHSDVLNKNINFNETPFYVQRRAEQWECPEIDNKKYPRRAGISSFGAGGSNAHIILEEYENSLHNNDSLNNEPRLIILSARNKDRLKAYVEEMINFISRDNKKEITSRENIEKELISLLSNIIGVKESEISISEAFEDYGIDPINLIEFANSINEKYNQTISTEEILKYGSLESVLDILYKEDKEIEEDTEEVNLLELAYTLQVGREALDERLAMVVKNIDELKEKLSLYLEGKNSLKETYTGNVVSNNVSSLLTEGKAGEEFLKIILVEKELEKLAQLWVSGVDIEWKKLYKEKLRKISLPTYPFAKERYWVPKKEAVNYNNKLNINKLHPLIDANTSTLKEQKYSTTFTGNEFYFTDHVISNQKILPGAAYIEMAHAAGELACENKILKIKDIMWTKPIRSNNEPLNLDISLYPNNDLVEYEITTNTDNNITLHSQGKLVESQDDIELDVIDLEAIKNNCKLLSGEDCYKQFISKGFKYGDAFKTITEIYSGATEALIHIKLPNALVKDFDKYTLHPSLIDGALQGVSGIRKYINDDTSYVPFSIEEMDIRGALNEECYVHATLNEGKHNGLRKYNISITDMKGVTLINIKNLTLRTLEPLNNKNKTIYYSDEWVESFKEKSNSKTKGSILIFTNDINIKDKVLNKLEDGIVIVRTGKCYEQLSDKVIQINPETKEDYIKLIKYLINNEITPKNIIHMWNTENYKEENIQEQLDYSAYSILYLFQALVEEKIRKVEFLYCFESEEDNNNPYNNGVSGLIKTISIENPSFKCKVVGLVNDTVNELIDIALEELNNNDVEVLYKNNIRYIKQFNELAITDNREIIFRQEGVYIITGGTGGLGSITAKYLAKTYNAKLILTGRSNINSKKEDLIKEIKQLGGEAIYIKADVSKQEDIEELIKVTKNNFRHINGVIHSAGVLRDSFLIKKTKEEMESVLAPKVYGTIYLDNATKGEQLDFFIVYSSAAGKLGNVGQCDYAYGNSFIDNYCINRDKLNKLGKRSGKSLSINWPLWKDGGMQVDKNTEKIMEESMGLVPLNTEDGIKALEDGLIVDANNLLVLSGKEYKIRNMIENSIENEEMVSKTRAENVDENKLYKKTEQLFKELLSKETKLPVSRIISHEYFDKYGIDSVMIMNLNKEFEKNFGQLPKTLLFEYKSIEELTKYFIENHKDKLIEKLGIDKEVKKVETSNIRVKENVIKKPRFSNDITVRKEKEVQDIAIIGLSGRYPMSYNILEFWKNLKEGKDCITEVPISRWDHSKYYDPDKNKKGKSYSKWGGFLDNIDKFDPLFFNISPKEAELMDPQERIFLETVWHTIEDAGYKKEELNGQSVGVFVGVMNGHYQMYGVEESMKGNVISLNSSYASIANRVSYCLNLNGPSIALDTMCSSSITAIHLACESIRNGDSDMVIAGGVNLSTHPNKYIGLSQGKFVSSDGRCRSFGEGGDGYVPGEGVGAVLLKPLEKAIEDKDQIYGVIKGSSLNHGGKTNGYTVPNPNAQSALIDKAIKRAGIDPRTISYIEAHGTGTSLGDPIEITGLVKAFGNYTKDKQYCSIGSAKSNIGHLESAAGIAGLTKVLLQMKYKKLVPSIHSQNLNPNINFKQTPFYVQHKYEEWKKPIINGEKIPRRAGISAFGAGGANAHIIIEEYEQTITQPGENKPEIIVLSATNKKRLKEYAINLVNYLNNPLVNKLTLKSIAYTLQVGREAMEERLAFVSNNIPNLINTLVAYIKGNADDKVIYLGNKNSDNSTLNRLLQVSKGKEFINEIIKNQELELIAELWASGVNLDWKIMYKEVLPSKVSLPTYPFAKERYWVPNKKEDATEKYNLEKDFDSTIDELELEKEFKEEVAMSLMMSDDTVNIINKWEEGKSVEEILEEKTKLYFMELISSAIKLPLERIEVDSPIEKYGIDSVVIMSLTNELEKDFGQLPKTLFFEYRTVNELTKYFLELYREELIELFHIDENQNLYIEEEKEVVEKVDVDEKAIINEDIIEENQNSILFDYDIETIDNIKPEKALELINIIENMSNEEIDKLLNNSIVDSYSDGEIQSDKALELLCDIDNMTDEEIERLLDDFSIDSHYKQEIPSDKALELLCDIDNMTDEEIHNILNQTDMISTNTIILDDEEIQPEIALELLNDIDKISDEKVTNLIKQIREGA